MAYAVSTTVVLFFLVVIFLLNNLVPQIVAQIKALGL